jgi:hypothetical protein
MLAQQRRRRPTCGTQLELSRPRISHRDMLRQRWWQYSTDAILQRGFVTVALQKVAE